jgi:hypothetical protein
MYRVTLLCSGIDPAVGQSAAADIENEFRDHRPWHQEVRCQFQNGNLTLVAVNEFDEAGLALLDEFSDCLSAYLADPGGDLRLISVEPA